MPSNSTHQNNPLPEAIFIAELHKKIRKKTLKLVKKNNLKNYILVFVFKGTPSMQQKSFFPPVCKKKTLPFLFWEQASFNS